jgi:NitT/TauT family transport system ATP-binding protein
MVEVATSIRQGQESDEAIQVLNLRKTYRAPSGRTVDAIGDVSFSANEGEFVSIVGRSGCGKSTLLKIVAGLLDSSSGVVRVFGSEVRSPLDNVGFVFQHPLLLPWRSALDNILLPSELVGKNRDDFRARALELISTVGLDGFEKAHPRGLSIGMQQRVAIARALILDPPILLMDEPFASLDELTREEMSEELLRVAQAMRKTVLFVTHSIPEAVMMGDRVVLLSERPSTVQLDLKIDLARPRDDSVRTSEAYVRYCETIRSELRVSRPQTEGPARQA